MPPALIRITNNHGLDFTNSQNQHCSGFKRCYIKNTGLDRSDHFHQFVTIHAEPSKPTEWPVILRNCRKYPYSILIGLIHAHFGACQCSSPPSLRSQEQMFSLDHGPCLAVLMRAGPHQWHAPVVASGTQNSMMSSTCFAEI